MINLAALQPKVDRQTYRPLYFQLSDPQHQLDLTSLLESGQVREVIDALPEAIEDLFKIDFPFVAPNSPEFAKTQEKYRQTRWPGEPAMTGVWVYYPWRQTLVHLPEAADYLKLRTARNKFLITAEEQQAFYEAKIGIAGLSVGSSVVQAIVLSGGGRHLRLADHDTLAITNLNRLPGSVCDLTRDKGLMAARRAYEVNPYQEIDLFLQGLTEETMANFFGQGETQLDLFIEEMDSIKLKIDSRFYARERRIPVIMATDNGDNTIIDVERFDLEPDRPLFHGTVDEERLRNIPANPPMSEKVKLANAIVGPDVTPRMQYSLTMVGSKLPAWPQLGNAATLSGAAISYVARRILTGQPMPSGRYEVNFDADIDPDYHTEAARQERAEKKADFIAGFKLIFGDES